VSAAEDLLVGPAALAAGLRALGYEVDEAVPQPLQGNVLLRISYRIRFGSRADETCTVGFIAPPDFPASAPGGLYVFPALRPLNSDSTMPHGGVTDVSSQFGENGWQYWSRPHDAWAQSTRDAKAWMAHVHRLFVHV
jgi:Prokaryotic E2 family E